MDSFPSDNDLNSRMIQSSNFLKWRELKQNIWYKIISKNEITTVKGTALILELEDKDKNSYEVFSTSLIQKELDQRSDVNYIRSTGKVEGKKYYGFDLSI